MTVLAIIPARALMWIVRHSPCPDLTFFVLFFSPVVVPLAFLIVWCHR